MYRVPAWKTGTGVAAKIGVLAGLAMLLAACTSSGDVSTAVSTDRSPEMYGALVDNGIKVPAVPKGRMAAYYQRQIVTTPRYLASYSPGTIVVDTRRRYLFLLMDDGTSRRYGIGIGRAGFGWAGEATIKAKRRWPKWHPPKEMQERDPLAAEWKNGMPGGLANPLGARALYLFEGNRDTLYRLHGTNNPESIGKAVSSGCVRLMNQDIIDLYKHVPVGTKVVVLGEPALDLDAVASFFGALLPS
jgi:lipoprotein-anchoring transpeptidase ErfK/SrfK